MSNVLLDSSFLIHVLRGSDPLYLELMGLYSCYASSIVLGELLYGALRSNNLERSLDEVFDITSSLSLVDVTPRTSDYYSEIKSDLALRGELIPENDVWIAASALEYNLELFTCDRHFARVQHLNVRFL